MTFLTPRSIPSIDLKLAAYCTWPWAPGQISPTLLLFSRGNCRLLPRVIWFCWDACCATSQGGLPFHSICSAISVLLSFLYSFFVLWFWLFLQSFSRFYLASIFYLTRFWPLRFSAIEFPGVNCVCYSCLALKCAVLHSLEFLHCAYLFLRTRPVPNHQCQMQTSCQIIAIWIENFSSEGRCWFTAHHTLLAEWRKSRCLSYISSPALWNIQTGPNSANLWVKL